MQIRLNTDQHVQGSESLGEWVGRELKDKLARFRETIRRVEVHSSDVDGVRTGTADERCLLEARLAARQPVAVSHDAGNVADAVHGATGKLLRAIESALGRERDAHGRESIRGE